MTEILTDLWLCFIVVALQISLHALTWSSGERHAAAKIHGREPPEGRHTISMLVVSGTLLTSFIAYCVGADLIGVQ